MIYLRFSGGVVTYPYSLARLRLDHPDVSFPVEMPTERLAEYDVFVVTEVARPAPSDAILKNVVEAAPVQVASVWTQQWTEADATAEEIAARQQATTDETARLAIKADAFVATFIAMTPAQVETYINNNTANLAEARALLVKIGKMMLLMARREFR